MADDGRLHIVSELQSEIPDLPTLLRLLASPLESVGLLPPKFRKYYKTPSPSFNIKKTFPSIQRALLSKVLPPWGPTLAEADALPLLHQYFCPDAMVNSLPAAGDVALCTYATLMSGASAGVDLTNSSVLDILERLVREYPIVRMYHTVFGSTGSGTDSAKGGVDWDDCVKNISMVPLKVSNAFLATKGTALDPSFPASLENATYFSNLATRLEELIFSLSSLSPKPSSTSIDALSYLVTKLVNIGLFPATPPTLRSQPSFFLTTLPKIRSRLRSSQSASSYSIFFPKLLQSLASIPLQSVLSSLFGSLKQSASSRVNEDSLSDTPIHRATIKREAALLKGLIGPLTSSSESDLWDIAAGLITSRDWDEFYARVFVCWVSSGHTGDAASLAAFLDTVIQLWSSPEHIKHSLLSKHKYTTCLLLLTMSALPAKSKPIQGLVGNPSFIQGVSIYISHGDPSVRRCGMLAAEVAAQLCGQKLNFEGWDGEGILDWARRLRKLIASKDVDAVSVEDSDSDSDDASDAASAHHGADEQPEEAPAPEASKAKTGITLNRSGYDSDDSLTGYASHSSSASPSRSASPTPSELAEIEKDPSLNVGVKKVTRPVYLPQLIVLLRGDAGTTGAKKSDDPHEADKIEMALNCAEELIRRKKGYGVELDENAPTLVYSFMALNDNYDLDGFIEKRQGALNALVACCPRKAAISIIEEFFKNQYSADQRFVALNALAVGARELASLPVPPSRVPKDRTEFPSKRLPGALHRKYIASQSSADKTLVPLLMDEVTKKALTEEQSDGHQAFARERLLRVQKPAKITEVSSKVSGSLNPFSLVNTPLPAQPLRFIEVASEFFIVPLINRFWQFLRDEQSREDRSAHKEGRGQYHGAGTGLILNALVLSQLVRTLAILVNAAQNAPEWLAVVAPDALELAVTVGMKPLSNAEGLGEGEDLEGEGGGKGGKDAALLTASLELALVVLDGALEVDGGRSLGLEHTALVFGVGEWAGKVFAAVEKGLKVQGGGGQHEAKLSRAAAGVILKIYALTNKWRRSMVDVV